MTSTLERTIPKTSIPERTGSASGLPASPKRRRPILLVASALVVFASIAVFATVYSSADRQTVVLVATRTIEQGQRFTGSDLGQASAAVTGGTALIPVTQASELAGKRAAVTIPTGSLLTSGDVTQAPSVPPGYAVVGLSLKVGQVPAAGVAPGDQVMIVQTASPGTPLTDPSIGDEAPTAGAGSSPTGVLVAQATVFDVEQPPPDTSGVMQLVSVEVSSTLAAAVSTAGVADQVALVVLPDGATAGGRPAADGGAS
ncbi:MAG: SAF domain-containing protein [Acidimicrobiales bacterium]